MRRLTPAGAESLAAAALACAGAGERAARETAHALVLAERDGLSSHGLARVPFYAAQIASGKIAGDAVPTVDVAGAAVRVDAHHGLSFPAIADGLAAGMEVSRDLGLAAISVTRSHHFGVAGQPVERLARAGLIGLAMSNTPAAMAPWGGSRALYGTDPIAFACPRTAGEPLVIDLSLSEVARGKVMLAAKEGRAIPEGWALDAAGNPTTDAEAAMAGSMAPMGGAKGAALALMVELLAAGLSGASFGHEASSMFSAEGPPPGLGHLILAIDPARFGGHFADRAETLFAAIAEQPGARLPGARRIAARADTSETLEIPGDLADELARLAGRAPAAT